MPDAVLCSIRSLLCVIKLLNIPIVSLPLSSTAFSFRSTNITPIQHCSIYRQSGLLSMLVANDAGCYRCRLPSIHACCKEYRKLVLEEKQINTEGFNMPKAGV